MTELTLADDGRDRWYPSPPPPLDDESDTTYTDRRSGADRTGRVPYNHPRNRQCAAGWHSECSDKTGSTCKCPCHADIMTDAEVAALPPQAREAGDVLAGLYDLPAATGYRVMTIAAEQSRRRAGMPDPVVRGAIAYALADTYKSRTSDAFLTDVVSVWHGAVNGTLKTRFGG